MRYAIPATKPSLAGSNVNISSYLDPNCSRMPGFATDMLEEGFRISF